jgi:D-proline reductase (dithiol) PrdB
MDYPLLELANVEQLHRKWQGRIAEAHHGVVYYPEKVAFTQPKKPMGESVVALASTGGAHLVSQIPFDMVDHAGDMTVRFIPGDTPLEEIVFTHDHTDHTDADQDPNCIFPLERLRELASRGVIGAVADIHASGSGFMPDPRPFLRNAVPEVIKRFQEVGVDVVLLTPG